MHGREKINTMHFWFHMIILSIGLKTVQCLQKMNLMQLAFRIICENIAVVLIGVVCRRITWYNENQKFEFLLEV